MAKKLYKGILADLDGTVNRGRLLIEGADHVYKELSGRGIRWMFVSNGATSLASDLARKLREMGLPVSEDQVVNSAAPLIRVLKQEYYRARVMVVGEPRLVEGVRGAGAMVTDDPMEIEIVISALDREFTYEKLKRAHQAIQRGAQFWATNLDATFPSADGFLPGAGSVAASIITAAGRPPDRVFGKPYPDMAFLALDVLGLSPEECLVVGDRMETDVLFAKNAGMDSALVLTGASSREQLKDFPQSPQYVFDSIVDVASLFD